MPQSPCTPCRRSCRRQPATGVAPLSQHHPDTPRQASRRQASGSHLRGLRVPIHSLEVHATSVLAAVIHHIGTAVIVVRDGVNTTPVLAPASIAGVHGRPHDVVVGSRVHAAIDSVVAHGQHVGLAAAYEPLSGHGSDGNYSNYSRMWRTHIGIVVVCLWIGASCQLASAAVNGGTGVVVGCCGVCATGEDA